MSTTMVATEQSVAYLRAQIAAIDAAEAIANAAASAIVSDEKNGLILGDTLESYRGLAPITPMAPLALMAVTPTPTSMIGLTHQELDVIMKALAMVTLSSDTSECPVNSNSKFAKANTKSLQIIMKALGMSLGFKAATIATKSSLEATLKGKKTKELEKVMEALGVPGHVSFNTNAHLASAIVNSLSSL